MVSNITASPSVSWEVMWKMRTSPVTGFFHSMVGKFSVARPLAAACATRSTPASGSVKPGPLGAGGSEPVQGERRPGRLAHGLADAHQ